MALFNTLRGKKVFSAALASAAASTTLVSETHAALRPKAPGETKIVAVFAHDNNHNGVSQELNVRSIFSAKKDWRIIFVRGNRYFTPELISNADLFIAHHGRSYDPIDLQKDGLSDTVERGAMLWTDENVTAIIDNIKNRGMGFMALHNTLYSMNEKIQDLLDVAPIYHNEIQPVWVHYLNQNHPITNGIGKFFINLDEQFGAVIKSQYTTILFESTAMHDKRRVAGGWCLESGKGRVVGLLPGHDLWPYRVRQYRDIFWRSAHWAMKRDIPSYPG